MVHPLPDPQAERVLTDEEQSRLDVWAASLQRLQDKYGYVVGGVKYGRVYKIGDVVKRVKNWKNGLHLESSTVVVGFSTWEEWKQQNSEIGCFSVEDVTKDHYTQFVKLRADD